ncbi:uncharacterized protein LOC124380119 isoform X2 [Silurus meridionalis]|uniref:uncharacterized protein LOC124380119 isoform X2 n=1 Tax=Silurus meridionalis TaxID=175797 RepID=UPI001EEBD902|nr:uncharacterized protein LOC124380119 isoform X2 [Silurus meridionalis]
MVTDAEKIVLSHPLILHTSHQAAELYALTRACVLSADTDVTIYTDSRYAFGVAHDFGRIWQSRGFTAADDLVPPQTEGKISPWTPTSNRRHSGAGL